MTDKRRTDRTPHPAARATYAAGAAWAVILAAGMGLAGAVQAADAQNVTLADALHQALRPDNPAIEQQGDNVAGAAGRLQEAKGAFDWRADASASRQQEYVGRILPNGVLTNQTQIVSGYSYTADVAKQFRNGWEIAPGVTEIATPQLGRGSEILPKLGLKIPVLRGSGSSVDAPERAAQEALRGARASRAFAEQQLAQNVATAFWRCLAAAKVRADSLEVRQRGDDYLRTLEKQQAEGLIEPMVVQQYKIGRLGEKLGLDRSQDDLNRCRRDLGYLLTGDHDQVGPIPVGDLPDIATLGPAVNRLRDQALIQQALDQRQDLQAAARNLSAAHENVVSAKDTLRPTLDLHIDPLQTSVVFSRPFGNNYGKGRTIQAHAQENAAVLALRNLRDQVSTQVSDTLSALRRSYSDWTAISAAEAQIATLLPDIEKRARLGTSSWGDYTNAENQLTSLRQQETNARLSFAIDLSTLELAIGAIDPDRPTELAQNLAKVPTTP